jgi:outer membrane receptor protein involved in Fe transport
VQDRVLGVGITSAPLFSALPGYGYFGIRGGVRVTERSDLFFDFENIGDKNYRNASWGMPGSGRGVNVQWKYRF